MKTCLTLCILWVATTAAAAELRLAERVVLTLRDVPQAELPATREALAGRTTPEAAISLTLPEGVRARIAWRSEADYCRKIDALGRFELHTWKTMMEAMSLRSLAKDGGWVSSCNAERLGPGATMVVYRHGRKAGEGKLEFRVIVDVFGESALGSITLTWVGAERDAAEAVVARALNSVRLAD